jgi:hypothetical protein
VRMAGAHVGELMEARSEGSTARAHEQRCREARLAALNSWSMRAQVVDLAACWAICIM